MRTHRPNPISMPAGFATSQRAHAALGAFIRFATAVAHLTIPGRPRFVDPLAATRSEAQAHRPRARTGSGLQSDLLGASTTATARPRRQRPNTPATHAA